MEALWWKYKSEGIAKNLSLQAFCSIHGVPYNQFEKFLKLRKDLSEVHPIKVTGVPENTYVEDSENLMDAKMQSAQAQSSASQAIPEVRLSIARGKDSNNNFPGETNLKKSGSPTRIMINIRMSNGMQIFRKNMNYPELCSLVEKLEVLC